ncbi:hypothetical protein Misp02_29160 [Microtetraspora sp. NBRC 16547]|nr:hypothetical protein Misp02_29160 [Microtetraspora sp. NBRC 16547]
MRAAQKAEQAQQLAAAFDAILNLHRVEFPPAQPFAAPESEQIPVLSIQDRHKRQELKGLGLFQREARAQAKRRAEEAAAKEIREIHLRQEKERRAIQDSLDAEWAALRGNDPKTVLSALEEAFEDNEAPAVAVGVEGGEVCIVVLVPGVDVVPDRWPSRTEAGNISLRKTPKKTISTYYKQMVAGYVLVTIREAFATAPGLTSARVIAIRMSGENAYGEAQLQCLLAVRITKAALAGIRWNTADAAQVINDAASEILIKQRGQAMELMPLDITHEPHLGSVMSLLQSALMT